jgi:hypothetical protein
MRQRGYGIADHNSAVIEDLREFGGCFYTLMSGEISLSTLLDWI